MGLLTLLLSFVFFAGVAMTVNEGLWSNTITVFIIIIAALIAIPWGFILGIVVIAAAQPPEQHQWAFYFACVWGVFALSATIMRLIADRSSRVRMRFVPQLDKFGGMLVGVLVATLFSSFLAVTLLRMPLKAGVWKADEGSYGKWMQQTASPIHTILVRFYGGEFADIVKQND